MPASKSMGRAGETSVNGKWPKVTAMGAITALGLL